MSRECRLPSLDYWRALAILMVVFWHFYPVDIELGRIGVRLFFVLSGFLVSRPLWQSLLADEPLPVRQFARARLLRILPSYFFFLAAATLLLNASLLNPEGVVIPSETLLSYVALYKNYNTDSSAGFGHIWSLCVEEHFYILLPLLFFGLRLIPRPLWAWTFASLLVSALAIRFVGHTLLFERMNLFYFSDPASTHNNLDCMLYGVLLRFAHETGHTPRGFATRVAAFAVGLAVLCGSIHLGTVSRFHYGVTMKAAESAAFALMIGATLNFTSVWLRPLQRIADVSYNWYLWHIPVLLVTQTYLGRSWLAFAVYVASGFATASFLSSVLERRVQARFSDKIQASPPPMDKRERQAA